MELRHIAAFQMAMPDLLLTILLFHWQLTCGKNDLQIAEKYNYKLRKNIFTKCGKYDMLSDIKCCCHIMSEGIYVSEKNRLFKKD